MSGKENHEPDIVENRAPNVINHESLICEDWMTSNIYSVQPGDSVLYALNLLKLHTINQLPVVDDGLLVGIVTDRDLRAVVQAGTAVEKLGPNGQRRPEDILVEKVMTRNVITLAPHSTVGNAAVVMRRGRIGSVPIVDGTRLIGILTRSDILDAFLSCENWMREREDRIVPAGRNAPQQERKPSNRVKH